MSSVVIACDGLSKCFTDIHRGETIVACEDISLCITRGEFITVIGPSGCGKTSLLYMIAGFEAKSGGQILVDGKPVTGPGPDRAVVFQEYALFPWLTLRRNVEYGPRQRGVPRALIRQQVDHVLSVVGLQAAQFRYPHELSAGMRQRAALARVLVNQPKILLMDEPFAALDAQTRAVLQRELSRLAVEMGLTVMFITHSVEEAVLLGDRVIAMSARPGRIMADVAVGLPRPRDPTSPEFNALRRTVDGLLAEASANLVDPLGNFG